jgi:hypothetical protein
VTLGYGATTIDARVRASGASRSRPGYLWGIVAYLAEPGGLLGEYMMDGFNLLRSGYAARWEVSNYRDRWTDEDTAYLFAVTEGPRSLERPFEVHPRLDSAGQEVSQRLRLVIRPDLPETPANEMLVTGFYVTEAGSEWLEDILQEEDARVLIQPGDTLSVGLVAFTADPFADATEPMDMRVVVEREGLRAESEGLCP